MPKPSPSHCLAIFRRPARPALAALAVLLGGLVLSACGSSSPGRNAAASEQASERQDEAKAANFAKCLREHGVHAETVSGPNGTHGLKIGGPGAEGAGSGPQAMEAAQKACARYRPEPKKVNLSPQQKVELEERVQKFARCMREHGVKVEAKTAGGGVQIGIHAHPGGGEPNPGSPGFERAQKACQSLMPRPPGAKGGAGPVFNSSAAAPKGGASAELSVAGG